MKNSEEIEKDYFLCLDCIKDIYLKKYIESKKTIKDYCTICQGYKNVINISLDNEVTSFARFLIRYHFPEYEYNPHWGGDYPPAQFYDDNPIISHLFVGNNNNCRDEEIEDFLNCLFELETCDNEIELYYGRDEDGRGVFLNSIKDEKSKIWKQYKDHLLNRNYYLLEEEAKSTLNNLLHNFKIKINQNTSYYRARIGYEEKEYNLDISKVIEKVPFQTEKLSAPPILKSKAGRANRQGVSYLYLSSDQKTAIGEVRPHPGHYVSVGEFTSQTEINLIDLRFIDLVEYYKDSSKLNLFKLFRDLSEELSLPILPDEQENYLVTQFISDIIRQLGYDGILFNSSLAQGHNLVVFNPKNFEYVDGSSRLLKITNIDFGFRPVLYQLDRFSERLIEK
jgi:hypothetical protein